MKLFGRISSEKNKKFYSVELAYSCLQYPHWFCRIWHKDWLSNLRHGTKEFGEGFGTNKFEAYRLALKDLFP